MKFLTKKKQNDILFNLAAIKSCVRLIGTGPSTIDSLLDEIFDDIYDISMDVAGHDGPFKVNRISESINRQANDLMGLRALSEYLDDLNESLYTDNDCKSEKEGDNEGLPN